MVQDSKLTKSISVNAFNRPIKVLYLVPTIESENTHWILDAIFKEAYTRWGGIHTLILPTDPNQFPDELYENWLAYYDPDFIYSYVDLEKDHIQKINSLCLPISFLKHENRFGATVERWTDFLPNWALYFNSVKSLSTLLSPYSIPSRRNQSSPHEEKTILTQWLNPSEERFLPDNFGVSHDTNQYTNPVPGLFKTLCYVGPTNPSINAGTIMVNSTFEALNEIAKGRIYTFANLSRVHTNDLNWVSSPAWRDGLILFVGDTCKDRINFWNSRLLVPQWTDTLGSIIIKPNDLEDADFITSFGNYLNSCNFGRNGQQPRVELHSLSMAKDELNEISLKLKPKTWSEIHVPSNFDSLACPSRTDLENLHFSRKNPILYRLTEVSNLVHAEGPAHFEYNFGSFSHLNDGTWAIDLDIERHNNLSRYVNQSDNWQMPRNQKVCAAFTNRLSKVSHDNKLTIIPSIPEKFGGQSESKVKYEVKLPSDLTFFRYLVANKVPRDQSDLRYDERNEYYKDISLSDKGENLRGVISIFDRLEEAYEILTNKLWRGALRRFGKSETVKDSLIHGMIPGDRGFKESYAKQHNLDFSKVTKYLKDSFMDSLEYLVEKKVLFQTHRWRCKFCGHINIKLIDNLKKENKCSICKTKYFAPIDLEWVFKFNSFVIDSLVVRNGLTVLWAIGHLHKSLVQGSFYYLPEVNLFFGQEGKEALEEIDILSVLDGKFLAGEVKQTATSFLRKEGEIEKFIIKIKALKPDIALLVFEDFTEKVDEIETVKAELNSVKSRIINEANLKSDGLKILVASATENFNSYDDNFGVVGPRLKNYF